MKPKSQGIKKQMTTTQNRLALIRRYLDRWSAMSRHNRQIVAEIVVEKFNELAMQEFLAGTGVEFSHSEDLCGDMRAHAQKLWRWLGAYEEVKPAPDKLWYVEQAIVASMPADMRLQYLNDVYANASVQVALKIDAGQTLLAFEHLVQEQAEATKSLAALLDGIDPGELDRAERELTEALGATASALSHVKALRVGGAQ
jgi:hypothetical protein